MDPAALGAFIPITAITLGCSIPIVGIIVEHFTKKAKLRVMEKAIEKGLPLEGLSLDDKKGPRMPYRSGMVILAVGIGLGIAAFFIGEMKILGVSAILCLIGIALIINDKINYDRLFKKEADQR